MENLIIITTEEQKVIEIINKMIELCEPIKYKDFNVWFKAKDVKKLREYEQEHNEVGIAKYDTPDEGISTVSIIATLTELLCGKRLGFDLDYDERFPPKNFDDCIIRGVEWYHAPTQKVIYKDEK